MTRAEVWVHFAGLAFAEAIKAPLPIIVDERERERVQDAMRAAAMTAAATWADDMVTEWAKRFEVLT